MSDRARTLPPVSRLEPEDVCDPEWADRYRLTPAERWRESGRLWAT